MTPSSSLPPDDLHPPGHGPGPGPNGLPGAGGGGPEAPSDALLREALEGLDAEAAEAPTPDPSSVAGHLAGPGDESVVAALAASPRFRQAVGDVVALRDAGALAPPSPALRERLLAAMPPRAAEPARAVRPVLSLPLRRVAAAAAVIAVATGGFLAVSSRVEAGPSLPVAGIDRVVSAGDVVAVVSEGAGTLAMGERVGPEASGRLAIRLPGGGRVVLDGADAVRVVRDAVRGAAALALEAGGVVVSALPGSPVLLLLPGGARVELDAGAALVEASLGGDSLPYGKPTQILRLTLPEGSLARFTPRSGGAQSLSGPASVGLTGGATSEGPVTAAAAAAIRRDLEFFGGPLRSEVFERVVSSRRFRIVDAGPGRARASDAAGLPAIRLDLSADPAAAPALVAWRADAASSSAPRTEALLRVRAAGDRPVAVVVGAGFDDGAGRAPAGGARVEAGPVETSVRVPVAIPSEGGGPDLLLSFRAEGGAAVVRFEGLAFPPAGAPAPAAPTIYVPEVPEVPERGSR